MFSLIWTFRVGAGVGARQGVRVVRKEIGKVSVATPEVVQEGVASLVVTGPSRGAASEAPRASGNSVRQRRGARVAAMERGVPSSQGSDDHRSREAASALQAATTSPWVERATDFGLSSSSLTAFLTTPMVSDIKRTQKIATPTGVRSACHRKGRGLGSASKVPGQQRRGCGCTPAGRRQALRGDD